MQYDRFLELARKISKETASPEEAIEYFNFIRGFEPQQQQQLEEKKQEPEQEPDLTILVVKLHPKTPGKRHAVLLRKLRSRKSHRKKLF
jgi:hypothetical protein